MRPGERSRYWWVSSRMISYQPPSLRLQPPPLPGGPLLLLLPRPLMVGKPLRMSAPATLVEHATPVPQSKPSAEAACNGSVGVAICLA